MTQSTPFTVGQPLDNGELLDALAEDGLVSPADAKRLRYTPRARTEGMRHPLEFIAAQKIPDPRSPGRVLDLDALLAWLGDKVGQAPFHIDPLRIDAAAVTAVMSLAFAKRHRILAVESTPTEVVIAVPLVYSNASPGWISGCEPTTPRPRTSCFSPLALTMIQCREISWAAMVPVLRMVMV